MNKILAGALLAAGLLLWGQDTEAQLCADPYYTVLELDYYHISVTGTDPFCVTVPGKFGIKIDKPSYLSIPAGAVTVQQKAGAPIMIDGANPSWNPNIVVVDVTGTSPPIGTEVEFFIKVAGIGELDPRVKVVGVSFRKDYQDHYIRETSAILDVALPGVQEVNSEYPLGSPPDPDDPRYEDDEHPKP